MLSMLSIKLKCICCGIEISTPKPCPSLFIRNNGECELRKNSDLINNIIYIALHLFSRFTFDKIIKLLMMIGLVMVIMMNYLLGAVCVSG